MKVSTKGRYGLRVLADLAVHQGEGPIPVNVLAQRQALSPLYLEQVFSALKKAGLVRSVKGPRGGYMLGASPSALTLGDILRALKLETNIPGTSPVLSLEGSVYIPAP